MLERQLRDFNDINNNNDDANNNEHLAHKVVGWLFFGFVKTNIIDNVFQMKRRTI